MKGQGSEQNGDNAVQEAAERAIVDLVRVRQKEVKRLEGELQRLQAHAEFLYRQFSEPAFPLGMLKWVDVLVPPHPFHEAQVCWGLGFKLPLLFLPLRCAFSFTFVQVFLMGERECGE